MKKTVSITRPSGRQLLVDMSLVDCVQLVDHGSSRRYYIIYKSGYRRRVDREDAVKIFDYLQPTLF